MKKNLFLNLGLMLAVSTFQGVQSMNQPLIIDMPNHLETTNISANQAYAPGCTLKMKLALAGTLSLGLFVWGIRYYFEQYNAAPDLSIGQSIY